MPRNRFIQDRIDDGSLVLYHDYRSGSLRDWSGNGNDGTFQGTATWAGKTGVTFIRTGSGGNIQVANSASIQGLTNATFAMLFPEIPGCFDAARSEKFLMRKGVAPNNWTWVLSGGTELNTRYKLGVDVLESRTPAGIRGTVGLQLVAMSVGVGVVPNTYINGAFFQAHDNVLNIPATAGVLTIGSNLTLATTTYGAISAALIFNRVLTALEHAQLYDALKRLD